MNQLLTNGWMTQAISVVAQLGVPEVLAEGPRPVAEIAAEVGAHAPTLNRVLRALTEIGVFTAQDGVYALTPLGATLRPGVPGTLASLAVMMGSHWQVAARGGLYDSVRTGRPASWTVWGTGLFGYLSEHPDDAAIFNEAMVEVSASSTAAVARGYDFDRFTTLVDVGGGHGYLIGAILAVNPNVRGVLFDQPEVVAGAGANLERLGVADRCELVGGSFFEAVPQGADAYIISNVLHDWDDERALVILRNCAKAMGPEATLMISEWVIPDGPEPEPVGKMLDVQMLIATDDGRERTHSEFDQLLAQAGLQLISATRGRPGLPTLLEARLR
jgi:DNA-binding Lrp family transcriptional regulator